MHNKQLTRLAHAVLALAFAAGEVGVALAHDAAGEESVQPVMRQTLPEMPGKQVTVVTVSYAPDQSSEPHVHPGSVFAYVLEGSVVSQLADEAPKTYTKGQGWYEPPQARHLVSRNASTTEPARLVAWLVGNEGQPLKEPLPH